MLTRTQPANPNGNTLTIVQLQREGTLQKGDIVSTDVLGRCVVVNGISTDAILVRSEATGQLIRIGGIGFPASVTLRTTDPREQLVRRAH